MADFYCFVCDEPVEVDPCPACGTSPWSTDGDWQAPRTDEHLREIARQARSTAAEEPDATSSGPLWARTEPVPDLPDRVERARPLSTIPGRWAPIAVLVAAGIVFLSVLTGPSGLEPEETVPEPPPITAQTTTTVPLPGSSRGLWAPPEGSWVGGFALRAARPETLFGPSMAAGKMEISADTVIYDSLPDGRLIGVDTASREVVVIGAGEEGPGRQITPLPFPGSQSTPPLLSPDGTRLAVIDGSGVPHIWPVDSDVVISPRDSTTTAVEAIAGMFWSPDSTVLALNAFQGGHYLWDQVTGGVSRSVLPGRAIAVSDRHVAAWGVDGLELREPGGGVIRRWGNLVPGEPTPGPPEGAFDPQLRYLAVRAFGEPEGREVVTVLSLVGTSRETLTAGRGQGFAWSGDGTGLYWLDANGGLQAWSADPERAPATLIGRGIAAFYPRLRVYDSAISPVQHEALRGSLLLELRNGLVSSRTSSGPRSVQDAEEGIASIVPAGMAGSLLSVTPAGDEHRVVLSTPAAGTTRVLGALTGSQFPPEDRLVGSVVVSPAEGSDLTDVELEATRWYLETDSGLILYGPDTGRFTSVAEGHSLSTLAGDVFYLTPDGSRIQTVPVGDEPTLILTARDLDAERILAFAAMRRALFVLVAGEDRATHIWQVPADSPLLATPLFPPAPSINSWAWIVYSSGDRITGGEILVEPDAGPTAELFAARLDVEGGILTQLIAVPLTIESVCGSAAGGACVMSTLPGRPLGFSPDGNWLLMDDGGRYFAVSGVGRGSFMFQDGAPDEIAWIGADG